MNRLKNIPRLWQAWGITTKFSVAFGALLILIMLVAIVSIAALIIIRRETETAITTSTEIQHLVLETDRKLEKARRLERDFFLRYPTAGYAAAYENYAQPAEEQVMQVKALSIELQKLLAGSEVSDAWIENKVNLNLYLSAADRHAATIEKATELIAQLAADETGLQAQLAQHSSRLHNMIQLANDPALLVLYHRMQSFEKDYLVTRQRPLMQSAFNVTVDLREAIKQSPVLDPEQQTQVLGHLDDYLATAEAMLELDVAIRGIFNEFDLQAEAVDPITAELVDLADQEVERARAQIGQTSRLVTTLLIVTALVGLGLAALIARIFNNSITRNVLKLTQTAGEFQTGNLTARVEIDSVDELGQLAGSFNAMALRIDELVGGLEQEVAERTEALRRERDFAASLIDTAQAIVLVLDTQGRIVRFNPYMEELSGYRLASVEGKDWFNTFLPPQDHTEIRELFKRAIGDIQTQGSVNRIVTKDGYERQIEWYDKTLKDADGNVVGLLAIGQDITERVQTEQRIQHLNAMLLAIRNVNQRIVREKDRGQLIKGICEDLIETRGYHNAWIALFDEAGQFETTAEAGLGQDFVPMLEHLQRCETTYCVQTALAQADILIIEDPYTTCVDCPLVGKYKGRQGMSMRLEHAGRVYGLLTVSILGEFVANQEEQILFKEVVEDIAFALHGLELEEKRRQTEQALRESEGRFRAIFEQAAVGVALIQSKTGDFRRINQRYADIVGYTIEEMEHLTFQEITHPDDLQKDLDNMQRLLDGEIREFSLEKRYYHKDGSIVWVNLAVSPMWEGGEEPGYHIAVVEDITERKQAEEALKEYSERLEEMVDERTQELRETQEQLIFQEKLATLGQLAGSVAHELRHPLGVLSNAAYYLIMTLSDADEKTREYLDIISDEVRKAQGIITALLDFARTKPAQPKEITVSPLVAQVLERDALPEDVRIITDIDPNLPPVFVDPIQIEMVLDNLVTNAYQAMPGGGQLTVSARTDEDKVRLSVQDTGTGISPENMAKLFEPLFTTKARGIGLGLALSKKLVEANGGTIEVESKTKQGSTFIINLPTVR
jgi:PAS domain S-box-containing protein